MVKTNDNLVKQRRTHTERRVLICQPLDIKQPDRGDREPGAELALILVLTIAITMDALGTVELVKNGTDPFLGQFRTTRIIEKPGDVKTRLVAVIIKGSQTGKSLDNRPAAEYLGSR